MPIGTRRVSNAPVFGADVRALVAPVTARQTRRVAEDEVRTVVPVAHQIWTASSFGRRNGLRATRCRHRRRCVVAARCGGSAPRIIRPADHRTERSRSRPRGDPGDDARSTRGQESVKAKLDWTFEELEGCWVVDATEPYRPTEIHGAIVDLLDELASQGTTTLHIDRDTPASPLRDRLRELKVKMVHRVSDASPGRVIVGTASSAGSTAAQVICDVAVHHASRADNVAKLATAEAMALARRGAVDLGDRRSPHGLGRNLVLRAAVRTAHDPLLTSTR